MDVNWREVRGIMLAGGLGGFLSWVNVQVLHEPLDLAWWAAIPCFVLLGCGAAPIGVYVVANVDMRSSVRALVFAMLCGFCWKPVLDAGSALIHQQEVRANDREVLDSLQMARDAAETLETGGAAAEPAAREVVRTVLDANRILDEASPQVRRTFQREAPRLLDQVFTPKLDQTTRKGLEERLEAEGAGRLVPRLRVPQSKTP